jgi:hypothetical protein
MLSRRLAATLISLTLTAGTSLSYSAPAVALERCGDRQPIVDVLAKNYDEHRRAIGIMGKSGFVEFFVSKAGTWTVIVSSPSGRACIVAAGHSWDDVPAEKNLTGI